MDPIEKLRAYGYTIKGDAVWHPKGFWRGVIDHKNKVLYLRMEVGLRLHDAGDYRLIHVSTLATPYMNWKGPNTLGEFLALVLTGEATLEEVL